MARRNRSIRNGRSSLLTALGASTIAAIIAAVVDADCLVGDVMYQEEDSIGYVGLECVNSTSFDALESFCGPNGTVVDVERQFKCPGEDAGVPFCVQCGPRGWGAALCLSTPDAGDRDCGDDGGGGGGGGAVEQDGDDVDNDGDIMDGPMRIVCPDGRAPVPDTFCGRGPDREDCAENEFCHIDPTDAFAVCCPGDGAIDKGEGAVEEENPASLSPSDRSTVDEEGGAGGEAGGEENPAALPDVVLAERERCGELLDMHLHLAPWLSDAGELLAELDTSGVDRGVLYAVYGPVAFPVQRDPNEHVSEIALESGGRIYGLASLNTTHPQWDEDGGTVRDAELDRLVTYMSRPEFVGAKLAPPHTCLQLDGGRMEDVVRTVAESPTVRRRVVAVHVGTTPFCGPIGAAVGLEACCSRPYVDPDLLDDLIGRYPNVTFLLLHAGHDFLPPDDENYYNGTLVDAAIDVARAHDNVYLEISAMHAQHPNGTLKYPGADAELVRMVDAGVADKVIWGSDANHLEGTLLPVLATSIEAMIDAGFTEEQRCMALSGLSRTIFGLDDPSSNVTTPTTSAASGRFVALLSDRGMVIQVLSQALLLAMIAAAISI